MPDYLLAIGGLLVFTLLLYYIFQENNWKGSRQLMFFGIVFLGTIGNGGISEGKNWGLLLWSANFMVLAPTFLLIQQLTAPLLLASVGLLFVHSVWVLFRVFMERWEDMKPRTMSQRKQVY